MLRAWALLDRWLARGWEVYQRSTGRPVSVATFEHRADALAAAGRWEALARSEGRLDLEDSYEVRLRSR